MDEELKNPNCLLLVSNRLKNADLVNPGFRRELPATLNLMKEAAAWGLFFKNICETSNHPLALTKADGQIAWSNLAFKAQTDKDRSIKNPPAIIVNDQQPENIDCSSNHKQQPSFDPSCITPEAPVDESNKSIDKPGETPIRRPKDKPASENQRSGLSLKAQIQELEASILKKALAGHSTREAANLLGINQSTLVRKMAALKNRS